MHGSVLRTMPGLIRDPARGKYAIVSTPLRLRDNPIGNAEPIHGGVRVQVLGMFTNEAFTSSFRIRFAYQAMKSIKLYVQHELVILGNVT